jgi:tRNA(Ile)-lysidine synthase
VSAAEAGRPISAVEAERLFHPLARASALVLAVSGGPDSTALLVLAARWRGARKDGPKLLAVTIDHGLRSQSADEARSVAQLARSLGVPHRILRWRGKKRRTRLQQAARAARYRLLAAFARAAKADHILTAHTLDDQAETVLIRMSRGSGITGLCAMQKVTALPIACAWRRSRNLLLVRPFLEIPKARLIATLARAGIEYADDASNRDPRFARVRMRDVMPALAREGLDAGRLAHLARRLERAERALESTVDAAMAEVSECPRGKVGPMVLDAERFLHLPAEIALRLLGRAIGHAGEAGSSLRLGKLEALHGALATTKVAAGTRLRRTLAGALVTLTATRLVVEPAPPRRARSRSHRRSGCLNHGGEDCAQDQRKRPEYKEKR